MISVRRLSPYLARMSSSSARITVSRRSGRARMSPRSWICVEQLLELGRDLVLLEAGQAMQAQVEDGLRLRVGKPVAVRRAGRTRPRGRRAASTDLARALQHLRHGARRPRAAISATFASAGDGEALMTAMTSSMFASATARPSRMWARSRALRRSKTVRRVTTSRRWRTNARASP